MKKYLLLSAMLLTAALTGCAGGPKPLPDPPAPSDEVRVAQGDVEVRKAVVDAVRESPELDWPRSFALSSAAGGFDGLRYLSVSTCSAAPCPAPPAAVAGQEGEEGHAAAGNSGTGAAQAAPAAGADSPALRLDGPRPPADQRDASQRKAPLQLPGPVEPISR